MRAVAICGGAALSQYGHGWRGLGTALADRSVLTGMPAEQPLVNPRARKMMSRGAYLAAHGLHELVRDAGFTAGHANTALYLGVGASGGSLADLTAMLAASIESDFSLARFGDAGLAACNPLLAFQLMNNFTLCHGAILEGIGGPNGALFSRGAGTTAALIEAVHAVASGECEQAIAGGADSATHPVTRAELARDGFLERGLVPAEGVGLVALAATGHCTIEGAAIANGEGRPLGDAVSDAVATLDVDGVDTLVIAPWGPPAADALQSWASRLGAGVVVDVSLGLGDALAASPALAWLAGLDLIVSQRAHRVLVLAGGTDGDVGAVLLGGGS